MKNKKFYLFLALALTIVIVSVEWNSFFNQNKIEASSDQSKTQLLTKIESLLNEYLDEHEANKENNDVNEESNFGPSKWSQFRMFSTNNAVFTNGNNNTIEKVFSTNDQVRATPVIVENQLYIGNHKTGDLFSFDLDSGEKIWANKVPNWVHSDMVFSEDKIFVGYGNRNFIMKGVKGTGDSGVAAFDANTGERLWQYPVIGNVMTSPAYSNGTIYFGTGNKQLYAVNADTGKLIWNIKLPGYVSMSHPNIKGNTLYISAGSLVAINVDTGNIKWKSDYLGSTTDIPAAVEDNTVVITGKKITKHLTDAEVEKYGNEKPNYHFIYGFNAKNGKLLWKELMGTGPNQANNTSGAVALHDGTAFVGSPYTKSFSSYNINDGKKNWEFKTNTRIKGAPAIKDNVVYFGDVKGTLYALDAEKGKLINKMEIGGALAPGGPVIINETLFIGSQSSKVHAIPLEKILN